MFPFSRTGLQRSKKKANADITSECTISQTSWRRFPLLPLMFTILWKDTFHYSLLTLVDHKRRGFTCFTRSVAQSAAPGHASRDGCLSAGFGRRRGVRGERLPVRGCLAERQLEPGHTSQVRSCSHRSSTFGYIRIKQQSGRKYRRQTQPETLMFGVNNGSFTS